MTEKRLAANHVRRLRTIRKTLLEMSEQWEDIDQFNVNALEELADKVEAVGMDLVVKDAGDNL